MNTFTVDQFERRGNQLRSNLDVLGVSSSELMESQLIRDGRGYVSMNVIGDGINRTFRPSMFLYYGGVVIGWLFRSNDGLEASIYLDGECQNLTLN